MYIELFGAAPTASGVSVTPQSAMRCTPVRAAVEAIAEGIGGLPVHVYVKDSQGARERATDHAAYGLLHDEANDWTPAAIFKEQVTRDALLHGNGYAFINRVNDEPRELHRLNPTAVTAAIDTRTAEPHYVLTEENGTKRVIRREDIIHIRAPSIDGIAGNSPVQQCREAIALAITIQDHIARLFGRGAKPSGVIRHPEKLGDVGKAKVKASLAAAHSGANSGSTVILDEGMDFKPVTLSSVETQTLELWQHAVIEIARIFRVPPHLIFQLDRATWGNADTMGASFLQFTLMRWIKVWEGELRLKLISKDDRKTHHVEFLTDDLLRSDLAARAEAYSKLISSRVLNPNEARARENLPPYVGGEVFVNPNTTATKPDTKPDNQDATNE